jgi:hypothetical protein
MKVLGFFLRMLVLLLPVAALGQNYRFDYIATTTAGQGFSVPLLAIPGAGVTFYSCSGASCSTLATTYNSATSTTACPTNAQVVLQMTASCASTADFQGNFGAWFLPGQYAYTLKVGVQSFGPYNFSIAGGSGGSGPTLQTNGVPNGSQTLLNLVQGNGIQLVNSGGMVTVNQAPLFAISTFTCAVCGTVEAGAVTSSPATFTAAYTSTPASATIGDGTNTTTLSTPFTSGSLAHTYCTAGQGVTSFTFTLTAVGPTTQTATQGLGCAARTFAGAGTAGATAATSSGTNAVLAGATGTLTSGGLGNQGSYTCTASSQKCYVLLAGGSHTFTSGGFAFPMNAPTAVAFVNQNGATTSLYLYESTNVLSGTFPLVVASFLFFPFLRRRKVRLASLLLLASPAMAQVQLGGPLYVPSPGNSSLGNTTVTMTNATCTVLTATGCTVTANSAAAAPWYRNQNIVGTLSAPQSLVYPLGGDYVINNTTAQTVNAGGATGATVAVAAGTKVEISATADGTGYTQLGVAGSVTASAIAAAIQTQTGCNTAGFVWQPQSNTCVAQSGGGGLPGAPSTLIGNVLATQPMFELSAVPRPALQTWLASLHNCAAAPCNIVVAEDSYSRYDQHNSSDGPALGFRWPDLLYKALVARYGSNGTGLVPVVMISQASPATADSDYWTISGTHDTSVSSLGPTQNSGANNSLMHLATGAVATFSSTSLNIPFDTFHLYYATSGSSGGCVLQADGTTSLGTANSTSGAVAGAVNGGYTARRFDAGTTLPLNTHSVTVTASGDCYIYGAQGTAGSVGVSVSNVALGAAYAQSFGSAPTTENAFTDILVNGTQGVIFMGEANEVDNSVGTTNYTTWVTAFIAHEQALSTNNPPSVLFALGPVNSTASAASFAPYTAAFVTMCGTLNIACTNVQDRWGATYNASSGYWATGVHFNTNGSQDIHSMVFSQFADSIAAQTPVATTLPCPNSTSTIDQNCNINPLNVVPSGGACAPGLNYYGVATYSSGVQLCDFNGSGSVPTPPAYNNSPFWMTHTISDANGGECYLVYHGGSASFASTNNATGYHCLPVNPGIFDLVVTTGVRPTLTQGISFGNNLCGLGTSGKIDGCDYSVYDNGSNAMGLSAGPGFSADVWTTSAGATIGFGLYNYAHTSFTQWLGVSAAGLANGTSGPLSMNSQKVTGMANGTASTDAVAFGQLSGYAPLFSPHNFVSRERTGATTATTLATTGNPSLWQVSANVTCDTAVSAATVTLSITYTDPSGTTQTITPTAAACTTLGAASVASVTQSINVAATSNIQVAAAIAGSPVYDIAAVATQLTNN